MDRSGPSRRSVRGAGALRAATWLGGVLILWLSWIPFDWEVRTGLPTQVEHTIAYAVAAAVAALAYPGIRRRTLVGAFVAVAALTEIGQLLTPDRTAQFIDFAASSAGAGVGISLGRAVVALAAGVTRR